MGDNGERGPLDPIYDRIEELLPAYVLNALEPEDREVVERALAGSSRYHEALAQYQHAASTLWEGHPPRMPSDELRRRVLTAVRDAPEPARDELTQRRQGPGKVSVGIWTAAASLLLLLGALTAFMAYQQRQMNRLEAQMVATAEQLQQTDAQADADVGQGELESLAAEIDLTRRQLVQQQVAMYWAAWPGVSTVTMEPRGDLEPQAMFMMSPDQTNGLLIVLGLRAPIGDAIYHLWLWDETRTPTSAASFAPDETGYVQVWLHLEEGMAGYRSVSITMEPSEDREQPVGDPMLRGSLPPSNLP